MVLILTFKIIILKMKIMMLMMMMMTIHTSFPRAVKQIKGSVYSFPVR